MSKPVRVRFAPSPTGFLHLGNLRSALFDYLYAQNQGGNFILRLEDTDRERFVPESVKFIEENLKWLGLDWDEGIEVGGPHEPYIQSERIGIYKKHAEELVNKGLAYRDYTTPEELAELRGRAEAEKRPFKFTKEMARTEAKGDEKFVIRFTIQPGDDVVWKDAVWGEQKWSRNVLDDFVAIKSDGFPTYNFANVVDDHEMEISHVLRGSEFLSTTPKNILVYEAFGWDMPEFVHLPPVLGQDKAKLSKRHGAKSALEYEGMGYLPEAVFNFLASLGFNDGTTKEIYSRDELIKAFSLDRIQSSPAVFDADRLEWMNGVYIRNLSINELYDRATGFWPESAKNADEAYKKRVLGLVQERLKYLAELPELTDFFFVEPEFDKKLIPKQLEQDRVKDLLKKVLGSLQKSDFSHDDLESRLRKLAEIEDVKTGPLFSLIRIAITGKTAAPGLFDTLNALGKEKSLHRLEKAI